MATSSLRLSIPLLTGLSTLIWVDEVAASFGGTPWLGSEAGVIVELLIEYERRTAPVTTDN
jgi:hypothetical protein